jgi:hypothetical protein
MGRDIGIFTIGVFLVLSLVVASSGEVQFTAPGGERAAPARHAQHPQPGAQPEAAPTPTSAQQAHEHSEAAPGARIAGQDSGRAGHADGHDAARAALAAGRGDDAHAHEDTATASQPRSTAAGAGHADGHDETAAHDGHGGDAAGHEDGHTAGHGDGQATGEDGGAHGEHGGHDAEHQGDGRVDGAEHPGDGQHPDPAWGSREEGFMPVAAPQNRMTGWTPKAVGETDIIRLQYGPYVIPAGSDLSRVDIEIVGADAQLIGAGPEARFADGSPVPHELMHIHHAHLVRPGPDGYSWVFGTGGESTRGRLQPVKEADPREDRWWGIPLHRGEPLAVISMPHNMGPRDLVIWLEFELEIIHGTREQILEATGRDYRPVQPILHGTTFNVPRTGGTYVWPRDMKPGDGSDEGQGQTDPNAFMSTPHRDNASVVPGVGHVWTAPSDGEIIIGSGHMHEGGLFVHAANLGSEDKPCADSRRPGFKGTSMVEISAFYPPGLFPAHPSMGITQPGWRAYVKKGDRIAINGVFDTRKFAYPDQMSFFGWYWDGDVTVPESKRCVSELVDEPEATWEEIVASLPFQIAKRTTDGEAMHDDHAHGDVLCIADGCNDYSAAPPKPGPATTEVLISNFEFKPGTSGGGAQAGLLGPMADGPPVVQRGQALNFRNLDYARGAVRHQVTSCYGPCNGPTVGHMGSYPQSDGLFFSGPIGYVPLAETGSGNNKATPSWSLDTSDLEPGYYGYYCKSHPSMRGGFWVAE